MVFIYLRKYISHCILADMKIVFFFPIISSLSFIFSVVLLFISIHFAIKYINILNQYVSRSQKEEAVSFRVAKTSEVNQLEKVHLL